MCHGITFLSFYYYRHGGRWNKTKVKVEFALDQATKAQRGSRGIGLLFL
jgi:hypothetical protein